MLPISTLPPECTVRSSSIGDSISRRSIYMWIPSERMSPVAAIPRTISCSGMNASSMRNQLHLVALLDPVSVEVVDGLVVSGLRRLAEIAGHKLEPAQGDRQRETGVLVGAGCHLAVVVGAR